MNDFRELNPPTEGAARWFVGVKEFGKAGWLSIHGDISTNITILDGLYFDTEMDAHKAALEYYVNNGERYPYLQQALEVGMRASAKKAGNINGSQVMEFI